jgi:hypothetical protein
MALTLYESLTRDRLIPDWAERLDGLDEDLAQWHEEIAAQFRRRTEQTQGP